MRGQIALGEAMGRSDYAIKTSRRRHFIQIFTEIIFEECFQLNLISLTRRLEHDHLYFLQELRINKTD